MPVEEGGGAAAGAVRAGGHPAERLAFRWPWRPYQARVLRALEAHLGDRRLHVIAAPGSGKTVLGLEIFRRIGVPAVVLSPTQTVRDQWIARLSDFLPEGTPGPPAWTATDLAQPAFLTSVTYQALHARYRGSEPDEEADEPVVETPPSEGELARLAALFEAKRIGLLILDEAHHLRNAWWKALSDLVGRLEGLTVVSLTATPPYDALGAEWRRYEALCGPVDEEISVPELVQSGTLCPHQDYVWAVAPTEHEARLLHDHEEALARITEALRASPELLDAVARHPWLQEPDPVAVLEDPELAGALLVYRRARGERLSPALLRVLGLREDEVPPPDLRWWRVLLDRYLFGGPWAASAEREAHREGLERRLRALGLLWRRELRIDEARPLTTLLSLSAAKLEACLEIHRLERSHRGDRLRQVILTDFIREGETDRLGAWPVFERLVAGVPPPERRRIALVTGRMAVLHEDGLAALEARSGAGQSPLEAAPAEGLPAFYRVRRGGAGGGLVEALTVLLQRGDLQVLVGTRALLGEGWDAPAVNSLVLASYVGSFVSTNQMRGRAIRRDAADPGKAASVWHLVTLGGATPAGLADWEGLRRRFGSFSGLAADRPVIENGLARLALPDPAAGASRQEEINAVAVRRLRETHRLGARWAEAIDRGAHRRLVPAVRVRRAPPRPRVLFWNTLRYLLLAGASAGYLGFFQTVRLATDARITYEHPLVVLAFAAAAALAVSLPPFVRAAVAWARTLPVDGVVRQVALAVRDALAEAGVLAPAGAPPGVEVRTAAGVYLISLRGGTFYEQAAFADAVDEVLGPVENPRYLITRTDGAGRREDYHAVPGLLAVNRERASCFHRHWTRRLGAARLLYTRTAEGRRMLLQARARAFSSTFVPAAERLDRWQ